ncbi:MAG: ABC transporter ATP-binding protein [Actinomycetota bacterium]|nr:ABC transporter ATP-binding protein [Actinomycetota bacterium]MDH5223669.1 ABC transporter ATP-binding protein [Actinomycetota bacterium]MDH5313324.1 ABC transporter ATP-binding protein [Actinomycetota bacterium]
MDPSLVLECEGLRKTFGDRVAVDDVGFSIAPGETYGLLGPNGAGKTTTISMICGLLTRDTGRVSLHGRNLDTGTVEVKADVGFVPQEIAIYPDLTARENLRFFGKLYDLSKPELDVRIDRILDMIGLADRENERTDDFSGGMKRRLNIGLGMLNDPKLLVLDEPTVGVDPQSRNAILDSVEALAGEGMAVLYTTHYMEEAERLCDRVGILDEGTLKAEGTRRELISLVGEHDRLRVEAHGNVGAAAAAAAAVAGVDEAIPHDGSIELLARDVRGSLAQIVRAIDETGTGITSIEVREPNLEAVFLHLTGRALRDEGPAEA